MLYIYKLGHCCDFGVAEFEFLTKKPALWYNENWLISTYFCDTMECGSIIFGGEIVEMENLTEKEKKSCEQKINWQSQKKEHEPQKYNPNFQKNSPSFAQNIQNQLAISAQEFCLQLEKYLIQTAPKKLLISVLSKSFESQKIFQIGKKSKINKLNLLDKLPNIGHFKASKNQLIILNNPLHHLFVKVQNESVNPIFLPESFKNKPFLLLKIQTVADQEYWSNLDQKLTGDMSRGLMNLKLARTLCNLTTKNTIWDPFCGSGRTMTSGWKLGKNFIMSDLEKSCEGEVLANLELLQKMDKFQNKLENIQKVNQDYREDGKSTEEVDENKTESKLQNGLKNPKLESENLTDLEKVKTNSSKLVSNFTMDASNLSKIITLPEFQNHDWQENVQNLAIITEGWLGKNFTKMPNNQEMKEQFEKLEKIWQKVLWESARLKIGEIIFCLPYFIQDKTQNLTQNSNQTRNYNSNLPKSTDDFSKTQTKPKQIILPPFINSILGNSSYQVAPLVGQNHLLYSRPNSFVGHLVMKLLIKN
jgi:hypothetical protein